MADIDDQWHKTVNGKRVRTAKFGKGRRWRARWRDESGQQRQQSFDIKPDAEKHLATVTADMLRRTYVDPKAGKVTFRDYAERWRKSQVHQDSSGARVESLFRNHAYPVFGDRQIASIRFSEGQAWIRGLEAGAGERNALMPATVKVLHGYVTAVFRAAVADKVIAESPFPGLKLTKPVKKRVTPPTAKQVAALYDAMAPQYRALVPLGMGSGVRQGEAIAVEVDSIDFLRRELSVRQQVVYLPGRAPFLRLPKGSKARTVPLADVVLEELARHIQEHPPVEVSIEDRTNPVRPVTRTARLLFPSPVGGAYRRNDFSSYVWQPARSKAGLPVAFTFHDLRHYFASALIRYGESVTAVQARLGHASAKETLDTYSHLWPDSEDRTRAAVADAFKTDVGQMWATGTGG